MDNVFVFCTEPEHPIVFSGTSSQNHRIKVALRQFAVYIANLFLLTSDACAPVVRDTELDVETADLYNLILLGSPVENTWVERYHGKVPLKYQDKTMTLGRFSFFFLEISPSRLSKSLDTPPPTPPPPPPLSQGLDLTLKTKKPLGKKLIHWLKEEATLTMR